MRTLIIAVTAAALAAAAGVGGSELAATAHPAAHAVALAQPGGTCPSCWHL